MIVKFRIFRAQEGKYEEYEVEAEEDSSVLDCLEKLRLSEVEDLVFNRACHHGVCGACAMRINGVERLACLTKVEEVVEEGTITLEPLSGFKVIKDLLIDPSPMFSKLSLVGASMLEVSDGVVKLDDCVECGSCYSACPMYSVFRDFLGPAAIHFASKSPEDVIPTRKVYFDGIWACLTCRRCWEVCPYQVDVPKDARKLRGLSLRGRLR